MPAQASLLAKPLATQRQAHHHNTSGPSESDVPDNPAYAQLVLSCSLQLLSEDSPAHCSVGVYAEALGLPTAQWVITSLLPGRNSTLVTYGRPGLN